VLVLYEGISKSSWIESITKHKVTILIGNSVPFKLVPFHGYAVGQAFLPLLEELLEPTFWNFMSEC